MKSIPIEELLQAMEKAKVFFIDQITIRNEKNAQKMEIPPENAIKDPEFAFNASIFQKSVHIYSHLDADGLCAAAILTKALERAKIGFQISILKQLELTYIEQIKNEVKDFNRFIIFADFGTGQYNLLKERLQITDFLILDHHTPELNEKTPSFNHINPYFYGIDGSYEISGAGICYYFAKTLNSQNIDLAPIAVVGGLGDLQNKGERGEFIGINLNILQDAKSIQKITTEINLAISRARPLTQAIAFNVPDKIPGLCGNEELTRKFLENHQIKPVNTLNEPRTLLDLSELEKKTLTNALVQYALVEQNLSPEFAKKLVTTFYILTDFDPREPISDAREMSSLLNACGRSGHPSLGIAAILGDKNALQEALNENRNYRKDIYKAIQWAKEHIRDYKYIKAVYGGDVIDEKVIGTIASMLIHSELQIDKPLIAYSDSDNNSFKVSARASTEIIQKGLDLSFIMRTVCQQLGLANPAGGHPPAAGAKIPSNLLKTFIEKVDETVGKMLRGEIKSDFNFKEYSKEIMEEQIEPL